MKRLSFTIINILLIISSCLFFSCKKKNKSPDVPKIPSGPSNGTINVPYTLSSSAIDPDGDSIAIRFDWGDEDTSDWSSYVAIDETVKMNHSWLSSDTYYVRSQAKDEDGDISFWSVAHSIVISPGWTFGGLSNDAGYEVQQTRDGGYILVGFTDSYGEGSSDIYLIKTDGIGSQQWYKTFGGINLDCGYSVQLTSDGGYIITGFTNQPVATRNDVYLIKTDASGDTIWTRTFGGSDFDYGYSVRQTRDGGYIIVGCTKSFGAGKRDVYLIKTDTNGDTLWTKTYGESFDDKGLSVLQSTDGGYIIVGYTKSSSADDRDVYFIKTDVNGNAVLTKTFSVNDLDVGYSVQQTNDGGYIIAGSTNGDVYLIKIDDNGNQQWYKTLGGLDSDVGYSVQQTSDGGYIIAGGTSSFGAGGADVYLIKTDANGNVK